MSIRHANYIHFDLKGSIPPLKAIMEQLTILRGYGYNGVMLEYEDRLNWRCWPCLGRNAFSRREHEELLNHCRSLGLEVVPLIQSLGHFEWVLKHDRYRHLRENNSVSELCPSWPETLERLFVWIDEVLGYHPGCRYLCIGGDEPFHLASCPVCRRRGAKMPYGKTSVYLEHINAVCQRVIEHGVRPIIWADAFSRSGNTDLTKLLHSEVILAEWRYNGDLKAQEKAIIQMQSGGHDVLGCSGICTGYYEHAYRIEERLDERFQNIDRWKKICKRRNIGRINTIWGRGTGLWEIYSPWHGHWPVMIYAGESGAWKKHPWHRFFQKLNAAVLRDRHTELLPLIGELDKLPAVNTPERDCLDYWKLAIHYQALVSESRFESAQLSVVKSIKPYMGEDPWVIKNRKKRLTELKKEYLQWAEEAKNFFASRDLTDSEEFISGRLVYLFSVGKCI